MSRLNEPMNLGLQSYVLNRVKRLDFYRTSYSSKDLDHNLHLDEQIESIINNIIGGFNYGY